MIVVDVCSMVIVHNIVVTKMGVLRAQFFAHTTIMTKRSISSHSDGATFVPIIDRTRWPSTKVLMLSAQSFVLDTITAKLSTISDDTSVEIFSLINGFWCSKILGVFKRMVTCMGYVVRIFLASFLMSFNPSFVISLCTKSA